VTQFVDTQRFARDRCGKVSMLNEAHTTGRRREMSLRALLARMRHDGCGVLPGQAELLTGIDAMSSRVRKIVVRSGPSDRSAPARGRGRSADLRSRHHDL
jgi:hypothetical protein